MIPFNYFLFRKRAGTWSHTVYCISYTKYLWTRHNPSVNPLMSSEVVDLLFEMTWSDLDKMIQERVLTERHWIVVVFGVRLHLNKIQRTTPKSRVTFRQKGEINESYILKLFWYWIYFEPWKMLKQRLKNHSRYCEKVFRKGTHMLNLSKHELTHTPRRSWDLLR